MLGRVVLVGVVVGALVVLGVEQRSDAQERAVARVADELVVPAAWSPLPAHARPDRLLCLSGGCPSVRRQWSVPASVSTAAFTASYTEAGWDLRLEHDCEPATTGQLGRRSCVASGQVDGWPVSLFLQPSATGAGAEVSLFVG